MTLKLQCFLKLQLKNSLEDYLQSYLCECRFINVYNGATHRGVLPSEVCIALMRMSGEFYFPI